LRRLFSTFARGWPGVGLLLLRAVAAASLIDEAIHQLRVAGLDYSSVPAVLAAGAGLLLLAGLWTPISGVVVAAIELWSAFTQPGDPRTYILLSCISAALALVGPGAWSLDARIFGWKRIEIRNRQS
jgi:putative oxidoreductase